MHRNFISLYPTNSMSNVLKVLFPFFGLIDSNLMNLCFSSIDFFTVSGYLQNIFLIIANGCNIFNLVTDHNHYGIVFSQKFINQIRSTKIIFICIYQLFKIILISKIVSSIFIQINTDLYSKIKFKRLIEKISIKS